MSVNKVILIGNLTKDVEVKNAGSSQVANFSIATNERYTDKAGNKVDKAEYHNIEVWGNLADICGKYLKRGDKVYLEGKLQNRSYEKDGIKVYTTSINCKEMKMLSQKDKKIVSEDQSDNLPF